MTDQNIKVTVEELRKLISIDNFIGEPIDAGDKVLIPVMRMGLGFGTGQNLIGKNDSDVVGAGAGVEPVSMVIVPKEGNTAEGIRAINLTKGTELNKALSDLGLVINDLIREYVIKPNQEDDDYDESEYIEPEYEEKSDEWFF